MSKTLCLAVLFALAASTASAQVTVPASVSCPTGYNLVAGNICQEVAPNPATIATLTPAVALPMTVVPVATPSATQSFAIDLAPIINEILQLVGIVLVAAIGWLVKRALTWVGLKVSTEQTAKFDDGLQKALAYGIGQTQGLIKAKGWDDPTVKSATLAAAVPYATQMFPAAIKGVGIPSDPAAQADAVARALDRAFPQAVTVAAASPATPPAPPVVPVAAA